MAKIGKQPSQYFLEIVKIMRFCARFIGLDLFDPNYRKNFLTYFIFCWIVAYPTFVISTILKEFKENWKIVLEALCLAITVFQGSTKFIVALVKKNIIFSSYVLLLDIYQDYENRGEVYKEVLIVNLNGVKKAMNILLITFMIPGLGILVMPFLMLLVDSSNRYLMMPLLIPYIDVNTTSGYFSTLGLQGTIVFEGTMGIFASDLLILMYFMQGFMFADILRLKIKELNIMLDDSENRSEMEILKSLMDIVKWQESYSSFTDTCNDCFYYFVTVCVCTSGIAIVLTLFMIITSDWPGAYPYLIVGFYTLYMYCILGTKIEIGNDQFIDEIYEINWYNMTPKQRKTVLFMLMRSQHPKTIEVAGILPLSVATGLRMTKTIYSILMMMLQFLVE